MTSVKAVFIGCSYDGQDLEMQAGKHDVLAVAKCIKDIYHVEKSIILCENSSSAMEPTRENILNAIEWLVSDEQYNERLFFYFAGHGGLNSDNISHILPTDHEDEGHISARELRRKLVDPLVDGKWLTAFFQHCHSGNSLELPYLYSHPDDINDDTYSRSRFSKPRCSVLCLGATNVRLLAYHDRRMSFATKALVKTLKDSTSLVGVFEALVDADHRAKPEFSCSYQAVGTEYFIEW